ncbi:hypothetical protein DPMN_152850 [Dreissena polymorpha]|uniref:Uncharacterized protein n=1 Tax=Dreissena polymorpha TaxID=45954 RepID=A0A9D4FKC0_DREPO|nr:hypothetical protein DPMN_152850 [Dreissena polymorpha]
MQLQNNRISINELDELLKEADQTLKRAQKASEQVSLETQRTVAKAMQSLDATILFVEQRLENITKNGAQQLDEMTYIMRERTEELKYEMHIRSDRIACDAKQFLEYKMVEFTQRIDNNIEDGILRIQQTANNKVQVDCGKGEADFDRQRKMDTLRISLREEMGGLIKASVTEHITPLLNEISALKQDNMTLSSKVAKLEQDRDNVKDHNGNKGYCSFLCNPWR